jgi:PKD repeat protein
MSPSHTFTTPGVYPVQLVVTDNKKATSATWLSITVQGSSTNQPPIARASATTTSGIAPLTVAFSSAGSIDPEGATLAVAWSFGDGTTSAASAPTKTYGAAGTYSVTLSVTDPLGLSSQASLVIVVQSVAPNQPPVARASANTTSGSAPLTVGFSSSGSFDPEGGALSYNWTFGDGSASTLANPTKTYSTPGTYAVALTVTDSKGASAAASLSIVVQTPAGGANKPPVATAFSSVATGKAPLTVNFYSSFSFDPDGFIVARWWDFGDGTSTPEMSPIHRFTAAGTYAVRLTITDHKGATGTATVEIPCAREASACNG